MLRHPRTNKRRRASPLRAVTGVRCDICLPPPPAGAIYVTAAGGSVAGMGSYQKNDILKWNGSAWSVLGTGVDSYVTTLAFDAGGNLVAGGAFTLAGGVSANKALREAFCSQTKYKVHIPAISLCTDNAAMIAGAAYYHLIEGQADELNFDVQPTWPLAEVA